VIGNYKFGRYGNFKQMFIRSYQWSSAWPFPRYILFSTDNIVLVSLSISLDIAEGGKGNAQLLSYHCLSLLRVRFYFSYYFEFLTEWKGLFLFFSRSDIFTFASRSKVPRLAHVAMNRSFRGSKVTKFAPNRVDEIIRPTFGLKPMLSALLITGLRAGLGPNFYS